MEFKGRLRHIYPKRLINPDQKSDLQDFFLTLGMIYNDIKNLIFFETLISEQYRKPKIGEATVHSAEFGGVMIWIHKTFVAYINEFLKLITENSRLFESEEFQKIVSELKGEKDVYENWEIIFKIANNISHKATKFSKAILKIRNNITFHFEGSGKNLRKGYIIKFFSKVKNTQNKWAYFSLEDTIERTRFYFSDAAVEQFIFNLSYNTSTKNEFRYGLDEEYRQFITETIKTINFLIISLMKCYLSKFEKETGI